MLSGEYPIDGDSSTTVIHQIKDARKNLKISNKIDHSSEIWKLINGMLRIKSEDRFEINEVVKHKALKLKSKEM